MIATGIGGFSEIANAVHTTDERGPRRLSPFTIPSFLANLAAGHVSIAHGFRGPIGAPVTACAAGARAIGDAARMIRSGEADIALCGGAEAAIHRVSLAGFAAARALSSAYSDQPESASRPFDRDRDGFVMGEGAGLIVIESLEHALARGHTAGRAGGLRHQRRCLSPDRRPGRRERRTSGHGDRYSPCRGDRRRD